MTIAIVFVTRNDNLSRLIGSRKSSLIPSELRKHPLLQKSSPSLLSYRVGAQMGHADFSDFLRSICRERQGVVLICDPELVNELSSYSLAVFAVAFPVPNAPNQIQNGIGAVLTRTLRAFAHLSNRFDEGNTRKLLLLPTNNFDANEMRELVKIFNPAVDVKNITSHLDDILRQLRDRQSPKRQKNYRQTYLVDDKSRYFEYGHENHALAETKIPPHHNSCEINAIFRFGRRYDEKRHYNVSEASGRISGVFTNCHHDAVEISERSHVNMFPNGMCS